MSSRGVGGRYLAVRSICHRRRGHATNDKEYAVLKLFTAAQVRAFDLWSKTRDEDGQTMAEYAVVLAVITVAILAALQFLAGGIGNALNKVGSILP
jgi:Flp pilus assembly pilin Flp